MPMASQSTENLRELAECVGRDWKHASEYYRLAEEDMDRRWDALIWPFIKNCDFSVCVDLAAGHGRNTRKLLEQPVCKNVYVVDVNQENIDFCAKRFSDEPRAKCMRNDGFTIGGVEPGSVTMFYSFDAMVHFDSDVVRSYIGEVRRLLESARGRAFLHHSNYGGNPGGDVHDNPHWRNFMTADLMKHYARKEGMVVENQAKLDWNHDQSYIDCFSLLRCAS